MVVVRFAAFDYGRYIICVRIYSACYFGDRPITIAEGHDLPKNVFDEVIEHLKGQYPNEFEVRPYDNVTFTDFTF